MKWINVNDRLPDHNEWCFVRYGTIDEPDDGTDIGGIDVAYHAHNSWHFLPKTDFGIELIVSYWMNEPEVPIKKG